MSLRSPFKRHFRAALAAHEIGQTARQFPLFGCGKSSVEHIGDDETEHAVAEEFEPLIRIEPGIGSRAYMG